MREEAAQVLRSRGTQLSPDLDAEVTKLVGPAQGYAGTIDVED